MALAEPLAPAAPLPAATRRLARAAAARLEEPRVLLGAALLVLLAAVAHRVLTMPGASAMAWPDAYAYLDGASNLIHHPSLVYGAAQHQIGVDAATRAYIYPPAGLLPFVPLVPLAETAGIGTAASVWVVADCLAAVAAVLLMARQLRLGPALTAGMVLLVAVSAPLLSEVGAVQVNGVVLLGVALAWRDLAGGRDTRAGVWLGLTVALKPVIPLLLVLPLLRRRRRTAAVALAVAVLPNLALLPVIGLDATRVYFTQVLPFLASHVTVSVDNLSPQSILGVAIGGQPYYPAHHAPLSPLHLAAVATGLALLLRAAIVVAWAAAVRRTDDLGLAVALTAAVVPVVTATVWAHYFLYLVPLLLWSVARASGRRRAVLIAVVAVLAINGRLGGYWMPDIQVSHSLGNLLFFGHGLLFALAVPVAVAAALVVAVRRTSPAAAPIPLG